MTQKKKEEKRKLKPAKKLTCMCGASCKDTSKERGRFLRRHPQASFILAYQESGKCITKKVAVKEA